MLILGSGMILVLLMVVSFGLLLYIKTKELKPHRASEYAVTVTVTVMSYLFSLHGFKVHLETESGNFYIGIFSLVMLILTVWVSFFTCKQR